MTNKAFGLPEGTVRGILAIIALISLCYLCIIMQNLVVLVGVVNTIVVFYFIKDKLTNTKTDTGTEPTDKEKG